MATPLPPGAAIPVTAPAPPDANGSNGPVFTAQAEPAGGGGAPWKLRLDPWWYWDQLTDWTTDPGGDINRQNNCLAECMAMVIKHLTNIELSASFIHDVMKGYSYVGYMSFTDAIHFFDRYAGISCDVVTATNLDELLWHEWDSLMHGWPYIELFYFSAPNAQDGHFRAGVGAKGHGTKTEHIITADPWTGAARVETPQEHWNWSQNSLIKIRRRRSILT